MTTLIRHRMWSSVLLRYGNVATCVAAVPIGLVLAYELVQRGPTFPLALIVLPAAAWLLASRRSAGLICAVVLILVAPYWQTLGSAQINIVRLAALAALITFVHLRRIRFTMVDGALLLFVVVVVVGWWLQYDHPGAGRVMTEELTPVALYVGARAFPSDRWPQLMLAVLLAGTFGALTVLYEYAHGGAVFIDPTQYLWNPSSQAIFRPGGIFGSPPGAATVLCVVIMYGAASLYQVHGRLKTVAVVCLGICALALISTFTRTAFIALAVGIFIFLWLMGAKVMRRPLRLAWTLAAAVGVVMVALPLLQKNSTFRQGILRSGLGQSTLTVRESYWKLALPIATADAHNFVFGIGTSALEAPGISDSAVIVPEMAKAPQVYENSLHNQYVTTLVEQGLVGLALLVLLLGLAFVGAGKVALRARDPVAAAVAASVIVLGITMLADTVLLHAPSFAMTMLVLGMGASVSSPTRGHGHDVRSGAD